MSSTSRIAATFEQLKAAGRMAFMPFVSCGDPNMAATLDVIRELAARGVDLIEVGFPYSDPIADGPVIQASYTRALNAGLKVADIFAGVQSLKGEQIAGRPVPPLVAMVAFAIIFRTGVERFLDTAKQAGFSGLIVPDLPGDEAADLFRQCQSRGLDLVQLVSPTTPPDRAERILQSASGFVYCISVAGTTGTRDTLPEELTAQLKWLRKKSKLPLAVGFGISQPNQVGTLKGVADGVIVGSAIVKKLESLAASPAERKQTLAAIGEFSASMLTATAAK